MLRLLHICSSLSLNDKNIFKCAKVFENLIVAPNAFYKAFIWPLFYWYTCSTHPMGIHVLLVAVQNHKSPVQPHGKLGAVMSMVPEGAAGVRLDPAKGFSKLQTIFMWCSPKRYWINGFIIVIWETVSKENIVKMTTLVKVCVRVIRQY